MSSSFLVIRAFAQQPTEDWAISASELAKDNLDRVAASESQITAVLNANPGLFVELKRWIAKDAADRGQILKDSDLTDSTILGRLGSDVKFRAAATRLLQSYGYLQARPNPDSEVGRRQAALEQERIRQAVADQHEQLTKCDGSSAPRYTSCHSSQKPPQKTGVQTGTSNPSELPRDRDFGQLLTNPAPQPTSGNGSLLRTSAVLPEGNDSGISSGSESDLDAYADLVRPDGTAGSRPAAAAYSRHSSTRGHESDRSQRRTITGHDLGSRSSLVTVFRYSLAVRHLCSLGDFVGFHWAFWPGSISKPDSGFGNDSHRFSGLP